MSGHSRNLTFEVTMHATLIPSSIPSEAAGKVRAPQGIEPGRKIQDSLGGAKPQLSFGTNRGVLGESGASVGALDHGLEVVRNSRREILNPVRGRFSLSQL